MKAVVEVGKQENFAVREGVEERRLIYAIERARFHLTDPV